MSGSLSNRVFALLCETTLFDKEVFAGWLSERWHKSRWFKTAIQYDKQTEFELPQVRDQVLNRHIALFTQIGINQTQLSDEHFINCVSAPRSCLENI